MNEKANFPAQTPQAATQLGISLFAFGESVLKMPILRMYPFGSQKSMQ